MIGGVAHCQGTKSNRCLCCNPDIVLGKAMGQIHAEFCQVLPANAVFSGSGVGLKNSLRFLLESRRYSNGTKQGLHYEKGKFSTNGRRARSVDSSP